MTQSNLDEAEYAPLPSSDDESDEPGIEDEDTCTPFELQQCFQKKFLIQDEVAVTLKKNYILHLAKDDLFTRLAAGLSDGTVHLFDISSERGISYSSTNLIESPLSTEGQNYIKSNCGVRFMDETANLLLVGTANQYVRLLDLRTQKEVGRFQNDVESETEKAYAPKNILCFDRNSNGRILCVGTEQHRNNVFLLFYDLRERKQLGGYFESHQDDITTLRFHPQNPDLLCSGSTDGLINIFDIQKSTEDEALLRTLNTESSVHKVNWHKNIYDKDIISCVTHTSDLKLYECLGDINAEFERAKIASSIKRKNVANCNLIDCHNMEDCGIFLLTGSYLNKGEIMRSLQVRNNNLLPCADFQGNKQIVRESVYDLSSEVLITAGESSIVSLWTQQTTMKSGITNLKAKKDKNKTAPY